MVKTSQKRKLYYQRDGAGLNNVRLQWECLVALAAITGRELVLPAKTDIAHIWQSVHELDMWSSTALASVVSFSLHHNGLNTRESHRELREAGVWTMNTSQEQKKFPPAGGWNTNLSRFPQDRDWFLEAWQSRVLNWECMVGLTAEQKAKAAHAVFYGVRIRKHWVSQARILLDRMGLQPGAYLAAHLRREDFEATSFMPNYRNQTAKDIARYLNKIGGHMPLLVAMNPLYGDRIWEDLQTNSTATKVLRLDEYLKFEDEISEISLTHLLLASAFSFVGTPHSSFTLHITKLRTQAFWDQGDVDLRHLYTTGRGNLIVCDVGFQRGNSADFENQFVYLPVEGRETEPIVLSEPSGRITRAMMYHRMEYNSPGCAPGLAITSSDECRRAVRHMGLSTVKQWVGSAPSIPLYCSVDEAKFPHAVFNWNAIGHPRADLAPLCRTAPYPTWQSLSEEVKQYSTAMSHPELELLSMSKKPATLLRARGKSHGILSGSLAVVFLYACSKFGRSKPYMAVQTTDACADTIGAGHKVA